MRADVLGATRLWDWISRASPSSIFRAALARFALDFPVPMGAFGKMNHRWRGFASISILTFIALWVGLSRSLSAFWSTNPQYAYGWTVPALALFLAWECWNTRPVPALPQRRGVAQFIAALLSLSLLPVFLLLEATPDWRFAHWSLAIGVVGISLCAIYLAGGRSWLLHFAFPIAFIFVAVPWPVKIEQSIIQTFSDWVTVLTVEGLNLLSIPAIQQGNVIEISTGKVGVEEACSGVRSFQATIMAALFLGQLWTFPLRSRFVLLAAGVGFAFFCNVLRAVFLAVVAENKGVEAIEQWHDPAGFTILGMSFFWDSSFSPLCFARKQGAHLRRSRAACPMRFRTVSPWALQHGFFSSP